MVLPDTAVTVVLATAPLSPATPGSGVFAPILRPCDHHAHGDAVEGWQGGRG